ncbi:MAG: alpha/beta hydrolase [Cyclobacteriaceae bacterium]
MKKLLIVFGLIVATATQAQNYSFDVKISGKGQPVLLIPGLASHGSVWDEAVENLNSKYECHVVTLPGFAGQPAVERENYLVSIGDELIGYLKDNKLKKSIVIGHSLGGFLTLYIGSNEPTLAQKLVVVDGLPFLAALQNPSATEESGEKMAEMMKAQMLNQTKAQYEAMQPLMLQTMITSDEDIATAMEWGRQSDGATVAQAMGDLYSIDLRDDLARITAPTLVLGAWYGYKDYGATLESTTQLYHDQFKNHKNYRLEMSAQGKHFIMWDDPEFFLRVVNDFLNEKI